ncbi:MAG: efflux RND transporter periplasmic adaptor subunit [Candidatus Zhuqueibacterota bacterium]
MDRPIQKKKWTSKKIIGIAGITAFALFVLYIFIFSDSSSKLNVDRERITISTVTHGPFQEFIPIIGNVHPVMTFYLDADEGGRVDEKFVEAGAFVRVGDKILKLTNTNLILNIMQREAELFRQSDNLRATRLQMEQYRLNLLTELNDLDYRLKKLNRLHDRNKVLAEQKLISDQEFEEIKDEFDYVTKRRVLAIETFRQDSLFRLSQIEEMNASLKRMTSNLDIARQKVENLTIKSPIAGLLTSLNAEIGESKSAGERLGQIDVLDSFNVRASIDEHYIARVEIGRTGRFDLSNSTYSLEVTRVYPEVKEGRFEIDLDFLGDPPADIRRGQTLHIRLDLGDLTDAILLPTGGFYQSTGGQWVYILDRSGHFAVKRKIQIHRSNTQVYEISAGLVPGEQVITSSYDNFGDKDKLILK